MGGRIANGFEKIKEPEESRILVVGLESAGKSTMLCRMKKGEVVATAPTIGLNIESVQFQNMNFTVWDTGSQNEKIRPLWLHYFKQAQGLIFVVDSADHERINVARAELTQILKEKFLMSIPLLVFANKQDFPHVMSPDEIASRLGLHKLHRGHWTVKAACAADGSGLADGLDWLASHLD